jgi:lysophospholipid acyltransferase (LPLAT)-like uncharacterized protein
MDTWDDSAVPLPFGRMAAVLGTPITVGEADDPEAARRAVENGLNAATDRAYAIADHQADADRG